MYKVFAKMYITVSGGSFYPRRFSFQATKNNVADYLVAPHIPAGRRLPRKQFNPRHVTDQRFNAPPCLGGLFAVFLYM